MLLRLAPHRMARRQLGMSATPFSPLFLQSHLTGQVNTENLATGLGKPLDGVLQTYRVFPSTGLVRAPYLSDLEASCLPIAAVTAWMAINGMERDGRGRGRGETVVCQGTGGVSMSGMQIAKASGATGMCSRHPLRKDMPLT